MAERAKKLSVSIIGAGRIGAVHASTILNHREADLSLVYDLDASAARSFADRYGCRDADTLEMALSPERVDAVIICAPTATHADLIEQAVQRDLAVFCEKPIDLDIKRVIDCQTKIGRHAKYVQMGFNRRFDPTHHALKIALSNGDIGKLQQIVLTSRDPSPPPPEYLMTSGGMFRDMLIHDFDMVRYLTEEEPVTVFASGASLISQEVKAAKDIDTALVTLTMQSGALVNIVSSRNCAYGYDQRIEAFGCDGCLLSANPHPNSLQRSLNEGTNCQPPLFSFFMDRYAAAYALEMDHFIDCALSRSTPTVGFQDGRRALEIADAADASWRTNQVIRLDG